MAVVNHYDTHFVLNLSEQQKTDLASFSRSDRQAHPRGAVAAQCRGTTITAPPTSVYPPGASPCTSQVHTAEHRLDQEEQRCLERRHMPDGAGEEHVGQPDLEHAR